MKIFSVAALCVVISAAGIASALAQTSPPTASNSSALPTRADVKADVAAWRAAGFKPPINFEHYPANAQHASRIVAEQRAQPPGQH